MSVLVEVLLPPIIANIISGIIVVLITKYILEKRYTLSGVEKKMKRMKSWKIGIIVALVIFVIGMVIIMGPYKEVTITKVPDLGGLAQAEAEVALEKIGLKPQFSESFSDSIDKHYVIPDTQDPKADIYVKKGSVVKVDISLGSFPIVIGMNEARGKKIIEEYLSPVIIKRRNKTVPIGYIYDQNPKVEGSVSPGSVVKLFINELLQVSIKSPFDGQEVYTLVLVEGNISGALYDGEYLWIAVNPQVTPLDWWPQTGGPIKPSEKTLTWKKIACIGAGKQEIGKEFDIAVLIVDAEFNSKFEDYLRDCEEKQDWPPITKEKIQKGVIEKKIFDRVTVVLKEVK